MYFSIKAGNANLFNPVSNEPMETSLSKWLHHPVEFCLDQKQGTDWQSHLEIIDPLLSASYSQSSLSCEERYPKDRFIRNQTIIKNLAVKMRGQVPHKEMNDKICQKCGWSRECNSQILYNCHPAPDIRAYLRQLSVSKPNKLKNKLNKHAYNRQGALM